MVSILGLSHWFCFWVYKLFWLVSDSDTTSVDSVCVRTLNDHRLRDCQTSTHGYSYCHTQKPCLFSTDCLYYGNLPSYGHGDGEVVSRLLRLPFALCNGVCSISDCYLLQPAS